MLLVDVTIVNVALPAIVGDLRASFTALQWVIDIYALALAALLLTAGSLADALGRRRLYLIGLVVFAAASLASGVAQNATELIVARGVQGIGGAAMFATTIALLNTSYRGRDRGTAYGVWGAVSGAAAGVGVVAGGALTELLSWRWVFLVNIPISAIAITLSIVVFTDGERRKVSLDIRGMATFTLAAAALTYGTIRAGEVGWSARSTLAAFAVGVVGLIAFVLLESRIDRPMLDLTLLRNKSFVGVLVAAFALSLSAFGYFAIVSIWLQSVLELSPLQAGLATLPLSLVAFVVAGALGRIMHDVKPALTIGGGLVAIGVGVLLMQLVGPDSSWLALLPGLLVIGVGVGISTPTLVSTGMAAVPLELGGTAAGVVNTSRQIGLAFGIALLGTTFQSRVATVLTDKDVPAADAVSRAVTGGQSGTVIQAAPEQVRASLDAAIHTAFASGLDSVFLVAGCVGVIGGLIAIVLLRAGQTATATADDDQKVAASN